MTLDNAPTSIAVNPAGTFVYVGHDYNEVGSQKISVIDTASNTVVTTIPIAGGPYDIAVHPAGTFVYVTNLSTGALSVIATASNTVVATVEGVDSGGGGHVAVHPAGTFVYVTSPSTGKLSVIDTSTNMVVATVVLIVGSPYDIAVHPAGTFVYVTSPNTPNVIINTITVIDTTTNTVVATVYVPAGAGTGFAGKSIDVHPAGTFVYVSNEAVRSDEAAVSVIATATNTVVATVPLLFGLNYGLAVHPEGTFVYATHWIPTYVVDPNVPAPNVSVIDTATYSLTPTTIMENFPRDIAIASGGVLPPDECNAFTPWTRRHIDRTNPQAEGWTANKGAGGGVIAKGINDNGLRAWFVDDNSVALGSLYTYEQIPEECEITRGKTIGWTLRTRVRVVDINQEPNFSVFVSYQDGTREWPMTFGADADGYPIVRLPTGTGPGTGLDYQVTENPNAYHLYELVFDPSRGEAALFVDGVQRHNYEGRAEGQTPLVYWGGGQSDTTGHGRYNLVEFFVGPGEQHSVGGSATGVTVRNVLCRNVSTGLEVVIPDVLTSWDCEDAGLVVNPGDRVNMTIRSIVD